MRYLILLAGLAVLVLSSISLWLTEGEVVTLVTTDSRGNEFETGLWIVSVEDVLHLRAESPDAAWLARIRSDPRVRVARGAELRGYRAVPLDDSGLRDRVDAAMDAKYGRLNRALLFVRDYRESVPIRLEPALGAPVVRAGPDAAEPLRPSLAAGAPR